MCILHIGIVYDLKTNYKIGPFNLNSPIDGEI